MIAPDPFALGGIDPLIALVALRDKIEGQMQAVDLTLPEAEYNATLAVFYDPIAKVEQQIGEAVPTSIAGAVAVLRFLLDWQEEWQDKEYTDKIVDNLIAGLERLGDWPEGST